MHELSVCQALVAQVETLARERSARAVLRIEVAIGPLSGVEPQLLAQAFPVASAGTLAEAAELVLHEPAIQVQCDRCGQVTEARPNRLLCAACGDWHTRLLSGDELLLERVALDCPESPDTLH